MATTSSWRPRVLIVGPGGVKGVAAIGCISLLETYGLLAHVDTFAGVSVGSIISLLLVIGYNGEQIEAISNTLDMNMDIPQNIITTFQQTRGLFSSDSMRQQLTQLVYDKMSYIPSMSQLQKETGRSLVTTCYDEVNNDTIYMDYQATPNLNCVEAVIRSMSIPILISSTRYVDGALGNPYPVDYFDNGTTNILGISLVTQYDTTRIISRITNLIQAPIQQRIHSIIQASSEHCRHIAIDCGNVDGISLKVEEDQRADLYKRGQEAARVFWQHLNTASYDVDDTVAIRQYIYPAHSTATANPSNLDVLPAAVGHKIAGLTCAGDEDYFGG